MKFYPLLLVVGSLSASFTPAAAQAQDTVPPATAVGTSAQVESRLVGSYSAFAGSEENARSLVMGLRQGSEITLTAPNAPGQAGETATFTPTTRPMGYGNVRISLALAREELARNGITQPTPTQLKAALAGGTIATGTGEPGTTARLPGVLQMRSAGMGWGQIANSMGVKLGHVMSDRGGQVAPTGSSARVEGASVAAPGITTAAGSASGGARLRGHANGVSAHPGTRGGGGIVNAAGGSGAGSSPGIRNGGNTGVVTGASSAAVSRASATGLAHGKGHAKP